LKNSTAESVLGSYDYWKGDYLALNKINRDLSLSIDINWKEKVILLLIIEYIPRVAKQIYFNKPPW